MQHKMCHCVFFVIKYVSCIIQMLYSDSEKLMHQLTLSTFCFNTNKMP